MPLPIAAILGIAAATGLVSGGISAFQGSRQNQMLADQANAQAQAEAQAAAMRRQQLNKMQSMVQGAPGLGKLPIANLPIANLPKLGQLPELHLPIMPEFQFKMPTIDKVRDYQKTAPHAEWGGVDQAASRQLSQAGGMLGASMAGSGMLGSGKHQGMQGQILGDMLSNLAQYKHQDIVQQQQFQEQMQAAYEQMILQRAMQQASLNLQTQQSQFGAFQGHHQSKAANVAGLHASRTHNILARHESDFRAEAARHQSQVNAASARHASQVAQQQAAYNAAMQKLGMQMNLMNDPAYSFVQTPRVQAPPVWQDTLLGAIGGGAAGVARGLGGIMAPGGVFGG